MRNQTMIGAVLVFVLLVTSVGGAAAQGDQNGSVDVDGVTRSYTLYVPSTYDSAQPAPLVIALHPFGWSGKAMEIITGFDAMADEQGFIVAYPDVFELGWDDGLDDLGWPTRLPSSDDVGFIAVLIDHLLAEYAIDPAQVYVTGWGDGGSMAYRLACEIPDRFAGVVVVNALIWDYQIDLCPEQPAAPVSILTLLGTENVDYPAGGRTESDKGADGKTIVVRALDVYHGSLWWANRNGCEPVEPDLDNMFTEYVYEGCDGGVSVAVRFLEGVGAMWPRVGDYALNQFGVDATRLVTDAFFGALDDASLQTYPAESTDRFGGSPRGYVLYVPPSYDPAQPTPVVMALHGRPGTAAGMAYLLDLNRVAAEQGFIAVYPDGSLVVPGQRGREWNYTRDAPGYDAYRVDDVAFLNTVIDDLDVDLNIDRQRLYATGFSNGGFMTQRLACDAAGTFAAFAEVGSGLFPYFVDVCEDKPPVPILIMHGTKDDSVPWEGSSVGENVLFYSIPDTFIFWALHDGCDPKDIDYTAIPPQNPAPQTTAHRYLLDSCADGTQVLYYVIEGGGHYLPGVPERLSPDVAALINTDIHAGEVIWEFFSQFTLPERD